ncbi:Dynein light chain 4, axonemal, partial [Blyttiomyces sp. JEL0837]
MADVGSTANLAAADKGGGGAPAAASDEKESRRNFNYSLICDMVDEMRIESVDMIVTAVEKHPGNYEAAAKNIKEQMDKRFGSSWHAVVGEGYGFDITHEMRNLMFMYFGGNVGILKFGLADSTPSIQRSAMADEQQTPAQPQDDDASAPKALGSMGSKSTSRKSLTNLSKSKTGSKASLSTRASQSKLTSSSRTGSKAQLASESKPATATAAADGATDAENAERPKTDDGAGTGEPQPADGSPENAEGGSPSTTADGGATAGENAGGESGAATADGAVATTGDESGVATAGGEGETSAGGTGEGQDQPAVGENSRTETQDVEIMETSMAGFQQDLLNENEEFAEYGDEIEIIAAASRVMESPVPNVDDISGFNFVNASYDDDSGELGGDGGVAAIGKGENVAGRVLLGNLVERADSALAIGETEGEEDGEGSGEGQGEGQEKVSREDEDRVKTPMMRASTPTLVVEVKNEDLLIDGEGGETGEVPVLEPSKVVEALVDEGIDREALIASIKLALDNKD